MMTSKIDPCPFCKTDDLIVESSAIHPDVIPSEDQVGTEWVQCQNDDCAAAGPFADTVIEAIVAWNNRT